MPVIDLSTYDGLCAGVAEWLNRGDLVDQIPAFVRLAEASLNRELRVRDMHVRAQAISQMEFVPLPADFLQEYSLAFNSAGASAAQPLRYVGKYSGDAVKASQRGGSPIFYTMIDDAFELIPRPQANTDLIMVYYARIPALGAPLPVAGEIEPPITGWPTRQTNWLLDKSPDLYLAMSLLQAAPYLNDAERLQTWATMAGAIMASMSLESERALRSTTQLTARAQAF